MRIFSVTTRVKHTRMIFLTMRSRAFRPIAVLLSVLLLASAPVQAGPVAIGDVMQIIGSYQNPPELRLRSFSQTSNTQVARSVESTDGAATIIDSSGIPRDTDSVLSGVAVESHDPQDPVIVVAQGDIDGTICDCGDVTVAAGFPKWPLLFLAAIPLFFIPDGDDCETCDQVTPTPTPTPNPTPTPQTPVPEPASLLLFGSGLAAFGMRLRKRRMQAKLNAQVETEEG
jgi:PEP-CTERM motif-containing protein